MNVINVSNLEKQFGRTTALKRIDLKVDQGEVHGFIGPNGAGKSTTIRTLLGAYRPTSGYVEIFGMDAWQDAVSIHRRLAYVPGDVNLWGNLKGKDVIDLLLKMNGVKDRSLKDKYIDRFELDVNKKCRTYSKGNRQKVALVAAFASNPELYIFDEPTSGLDPLMEMVFQDCVEEEKNNGKTILLSSHILSEVEKLADKVSVIRKGEIIESGTLEDLRHLTRTEIKVITQKPLESLNHLPGIYDVRKERNKVIFQVDTPRVGEIMAYLTPFGIEDIEVAPLDLEELFMNYYQTGEE